MFHRGRGSNSEPLEQVSTSDTHQRVFHVLDQIIGTIPEEMRDHPMAKMLVTFAKEGKKDLARIPAPFIEQLGQQIGEAFLWVANGKMSDLSDEESESEHS